MISGSGSGYSVARTSREVRENSAKASLIGIAEIDGSKLAPYFPKKQFEDATYFLYISDDFIAWSPYQAIGWLARAEIRSIQITSFSHEVEAKVQQFNRQHLDRLRSVLRAKNKCRDSVVTPFNDLDISLLRHFAEVVAYAYGIENHAAAEKTQLECETNLRKQLEKTNEQLTDFIETFQHELRSPLTIFTQIRERLTRDLHFHEMIQPGEPLPKRIREFCEDTESVAGRLAFITNSMELHPSDLVHEHRQCDCFKEIVAPILTFAVLYARNRSFDLRCNKQSLFLRVFCDPLAASLALHTLIDNAIKYADPGTAITVEGRPRADGCTIRVSDFGLCVHPEEKERIFEKHIRGIEPTRQKIHGAGIGLYLAREIMRRNNGNVTLANLAKPVAFDLFISSLKSK
jgi:signal transduction histidine kinase